MRAEVEEDERAVLVADRSKLPVASFVAQSAMFVFKSGSQCS